MKYIQVKFGWSEKYLVPCNEESGTLLVALGNAIKVSVETKDKLEFFKQLDSDMELSFVTNPRFEEPTPVEKELLAKIAANDTRWIEYYNKANAAEKRVKELEEQLKGIQGKVTEAVSPAEKTEDVPF